jgi:hypothetical protein
MPDTATLTSIEGIELIEPFEDTLDDCPGHDSYLIITDNPYLLDFM